MSFLIIDFHFQLNYYHCNFIHEFNHFYFLLDDIVDIIIYAY